MSPLVSIIVPALNEEATIQELLGRLIALPFEKEILVVNDGSTDGTARILDSFGSQIVVLTNPQRGGKGNAIRQALKVAQGEIVVIQDADLEYFPEDLPALIAPFADAKVQVVYGSRFSRGLIAGMALPNKLVNLMLVWAVQILFGKRLTDEATCYKAVRRSTMQGMDLQCQRFEFCPEVTAKALRLGHDILEIPIRYQPRSKKAGKKIRFSDAPEAFLTLWKYRRWRPKIGTN